MTLSEMIKAAEDHKKGIKRLRDDELQFLKVLLEAYAEEILSVGQTVVLSSVQITKTISGKVIVDIADSGTDP